jgi:N-acyl-D-aspartate/D-glutamate deacylase
MKKVNLFFLLSLLLASCQTPPSADLILSGGMIHDGSADDPFQGDIVIQGDSIVYVGPSEGHNWAATQMIDAEGYTIAPGFIDPHTHADRILGDSTKRANLSYLYQGVTTIFVGSDGRGPLNISEHHVRYEKLGVGTNIALYIGHQTIREAVLGVEDRPPSEDELERMKAMVAQGMEEGAMGLSAGLYYFPSSFAATEEVIELAKVAAEYGGVYDVHMRDESTYNIGLLNAVRETIEIAEKANIHGNIAHVKALGVDVWGQSHEIIRLVDSARTAGISVSADQYPYNASSTGLSAALVPRWVRANDTEWTRKFSNPLLLPSIKEEMAENLRKRGGPSAILLSVPYADSIKGYTLEDLAGRWNMEPLDAAIEVLKKGGSSIVSFNMQESDIRNLMAQSWVMTSSDGGTGHPRLYGSFPRKIRKYVFEDQALSLTEMIHRSTGLTASTLKVPERGYLKPGFKADVIVFKPEEVKDMATFESPAELAVGMEYVIVNGQLAIEKGEFTGAVAGQIVRNQE